MASSKTDRFLKEMEMKAGCPLWFTLVAAHPSLPLHLLETLAADEREAVRKAVAENPATPPELLEKLAKDKKAKVRESVAANPGTTPALLKKLTKDRKEEVRWKAAENPNTPVEALKALALKETSCFCLGIIAKNPSTPVDLLEELMKSDVRDPMEQLPESLAGNPLLPTRWLEKFAKSDQRFVRAAVARNPSTPVEMLEQLAKDQEVYVRQHVAINPQTPAPLMEKLVRDENPGVRGWVGENPKAPPALLEILAKDKDAFVRKEAAGNPNMPANILETLAEDKEAEVRVGVGLNPNTPLAAIEKLAEDSDSDVRKNVGFNPNAPISVLERLSNDPDGDARIGALQNPNLPVAVLERLVSEVLGEAGQSGDKSLSYTLEICDLDGTTHQVDMQNKVCTCKTYSKSKTCEQVEQFCAGDSSCASGSHKPHLLLLKPDADSMLSFGGVPVTNRGKKFRWPSCKACKSPMQFLGKIPTSAGLLQIFMCAANPGSCETWEADAGCNKVLVTRVHELEKVPEPEDEDAVRDFEYGATLKAFDFDYADRPTGSDQRVLGQIHGDPEWIQGDETPKCNKCKKPMQFVVQLEDWGPAANDMGFGAGGCGYVFTCDCPGSAKLLWQCG